MNRQNNDSFAFDLSMKQQSSQSSFLSTNQNPTTVVADQVTDTVFGLAYVPLKDDIYNVEPNRQCKVGGASERQCFRNALQSNLTRTLNVMIIGPDALTDGFKKELAEFCQMENFNFTCYAAKEPESNKIVTTDFFIFLISLSQMKSGDSMKKSMEIVRSRNKTFHLCSFAVNITSPLGKSDNALSSEEIKKDLLQEFRLQWFTFSVVNRETKCNNLRRMCLTIRNKCSELSLF